MSISLSDLTEEGRKAWEKNAEKHTVEYYKIVDKRRAEEAKMEAFVNRVFYGSSQSYSHS